MAKILKMFLLLLVIFPIYSMNIRTKRKRIDVLCATHAKRRKLIPAHEQQKEVVRKARAAYFSARYQQYTFY